MVFFTCVENQENKPIPFMSLMEKNENNIKIKPSRRKLNCCNVIKRWL